MYLLPMGIAFFGTETCNRHKGERIFFAASCACRYQLHVYDAPSYFTWRTAIWPAFQNLNRIGASLLLFSHVPATKVRDVSRRLKAIHAQENRAAAEAKAHAVVEALRSQRMTRTAELVETHVGETLTYYGFSG